MFDPDIANLLRDVSGLLGTVRGVTWSAQCSMQPPATESYTGFPSQAGTDATARRLEC